MTTEDMAAQAERSVRKCCEQMHSVDTSGGLERVYGRAHALVEYVMRTGIVCAERGMTLMHDVDRAYRGARQRLSHKNFFPYGEPGRKWGNLGECA